MLTIILIVVAVVALSMISWVVARKAPQLSAMNVEETPQAKARLLKQAIVAAKFLRRLRELQSKFAAPESWRRFSGRVRDAYQRLKALEEKYTTHTKDAKITLLLKRGTDALTEDAEEAEQCFLEIITLDPHNLEAYEGLLQIYLAKSSLKEAGEVAQFLMKLNPAASGRYLFLLAAAYREAEDNKAAWKYGTQAATFEPANPKYLDFLVELAILEKRKQAGEKYLARLKEVNPDNAKIEEWEERIKNLE